MDYVGIYRNPEIQLLLNQFVTEEKYGDYKPIIDEIVQRRAHEYKFSPKRIQLELQNLVRNLDSFVMAGPEKMAEIGESTIGAYSLNDKKIFLNAEYFKEMGKYLNENLQEIDARWILGKRVYHAVTHEVYHAINQQPNNDIGISYKDENGIRTGNHMNEIITESAARRTLLNRTDQERINGFVQTDYYESLTSTTALMANIIGVSENSLLAHGLNDRKEFKNFILENLPENMSDREKEQIFSRFLFKVGALAQMIDIAPTDVLASLYKNYYASFFSVAEQCMEKEKENPTKETIGSMHYRVVRLARITNASIQYLKDRDVITEEEQNEILNSPELLEEYERLREIVLDTYKLQKGKNFVNQTKDEVEQALLQDMMVDPEYAKKRNELYKEDNVQTALWDNSVFQYTFNVIRDNLKEYDLQNAKDKVLKVEEGTTKQIIENLGVPKDALIGQQPKDFDDDDGR